VLPLLTLPYKHRDWCSVSSLSSVLSFYVFSSIALFVILLSVFCRCLGSHSFCDLKWSHVRLRRSRHVAAVSCTLTRSFIVKLLSYIFFFCVFMICFGTSIRIVRKFVTVICLCVFVCPLHGALLSLCMVLSLCSLWSVVSVGQHLHL
jgi:hypothetical protein